MVLVSFLSYVDCFSPTLGHTALRCVGLEQSQARWLMLPATIYFVAGLVTGINWMRLTLAQRDIRSLHFGYLTLHGLLVFTLAVADYTHQADHVPYSSSRTIGGLSVLTTITLIGSITTFLPPRQALKQILDRALTATGFASVIQVLLASVSRFTPDGLNKETANNVYAAGACMMAFVLLSLVASQQSRFFALPVVNSNDYHVFVSLGWKANVTFIVALLFLLTQAPFAFVNQPSFSALLAASMMGSLGYVLLVATSIVAHYNATMLNTMLSMPQGREKEMQKRREEAFHIEGELGTHPIHPASREEISAQDAERSVVHGNLGARRRSRRHSQEHIDNRGSVIWKGDAAIASRLQIQSGVSAASWDRLESLMQARRRAQSNLTYYGSEQSYAHQEGTQTRPTSIMTSAGLATFFGVGGRGRQNDDEIPPVPTIDPRNLTSQEDMNEVVVAKPLTDGDAPIVLSPAPTACTERYNSPLRRNLESLPGRLGMGAQTVSKGESALSKDTAYASSMTDHTHYDTKGRGCSADTTVKTSDQTVATADPRSSQVDSIRGLAMRYSSTKLFPSPMTASVQVANSKVGKGQTEDEEKQIEFTTQYATRHADNSMSSGKLATMEDHADEKFRKRATSDSADEGKKFSERNVTHGLQSPDAITASRKVNRGKVIRKVDVAEDPNARLTTAILFPSAH